MAKVAIYCRVDHGSITYGQFAIDRQKKQLEQYIKIHGLRIAGFYSDCGYAGSDLERPGLQKLIHDCETGKFTTVVITKRDRLHCGSSSTAPQWPFKVITLSYSRKR